MIQKTPKGLRLHIGIYGKRNVGKSSLLNAVTRQNVSIVSSHSGTTTDPVEKPMEFLPIGPVLFIDTAGIDDDGDIGNLRIKKTEQCFDRTDVGIIVTEGDSWGGFEDTIKEELQKRSIPIIVVFNKSDISKPTNATLSVLEKSSILYVQTIASERKGVVGFREALIKSVPDDFINSPSILGDLVNPGEMVVLVIPIDKEAPKGRLILPQVQTIRDILDSDACCVVAKDRELSAVLKQLRTPPKLVITDSQAFEEVAANTPQEILMTSFSILFARFKGDLVSQVRDTMVIDSLQNGDKILVAEACSHHPITDDIGRVKIPQWLGEYTGKELNFTTVQGHDYPSDLSTYKLVIHCGACMHNRREMLSRIQRCHDAGVPITNYGLTIAYGFNIFERALKPFPAAIKEYKIC